MTEPPVDPVDPAEPTPPQDDTPTPSPQPPPAPASEGPIPVPPKTIGPPSGPAFGSSGSVYDEKVLWRTTAWTVGICALATYLFFFVALAIPLVMLVTLFFISKKNSPQKRARVAGIILGCGIGLLVSAGVCGALANGLPSPFLGGLFGG